MSYRLILNPSTDKKEIALFSTKEGALLYAELLFKTKVLNGNDSLQLIKVEDTCPYASYNPMEDMEENFEFERDY